MTGPAVTGSCPKCGSTATHAVSVKRAAVSDALAKEFLQTSGAGAAGGQDTVTQGVCTRCGCRWVPRTGEERRLRALSGQLGQEAMLAALTAASAEGARAKARAASVFARISPLTWLLIAGIAIELVLLLVT